MNISTQQLSVPQRIESRSCLRNLEVFLNYRWNLNEKKKLSLIEEKVYQHAVPRLKIVEAQPSSLEKWHLWWNDGLNLRKISHYVTSKIPVWEQTIKNDSKKLVALERQCALFERIIDKYNLVNGKPAHDPIPFVNPFKKVASVMINYPAIIGQSVQGTVKQDFEYDRLTSAEEFKRRFNEIVNQPVWMQFSGSPSLQTEQKISHYFSVVPNALFRKVVQEPEVLFDPTDDQLRESPQTIHVSYDDPDPGVLSVLVFQEGEKKSQS